MSQEKIDRLTREAEEAHERLRIAEQEYMCEMYEIDDNFHPLPWKHKPAEMTMGNGPDGDDQVIDSDGVCVLSTGDTPSIKVLLNIVERINRS